MNQEEENITFLDADANTSTPQAAVTYEQVVINQIKKCIDEGSKEMKGGYFQEKQTSRGIIDIYVGNQQEIYINSINSLHDLLLPYFDDDFVKDKETFDNKIKDTKEKVNVILNAKKEMLVKDSDKLSIDFQLEYGYLDPDSFEAKMFNDKKLESFRFMLQSLIKLYQRKRFLMGDFIDDEREL